MWTLWNKIYFIKNSFWKFYEVRSERGGFQLIQILSLLGMYILWCWGSRSQDVFTFVQIGSGHTEIIFVKKGCKVRVSNASCTWFFDKDKQSRTNPMFTHKYSRKLGICFFLIICGWNSLLRENIILFYLLSLLKNVLNLRSSAAERRFKTFFNKDSK